MKGTPYTHVQEPSKHDPRIRYYFKPDYYKEEATAKSKTANDNQKIKVSNEIIYELPKYNPSTFVKLETIKSEELNYFVPEKWN